MADPEWSVHVERPDGRAGDEDVRVHAKDEADARAKALAATDPSFTVVVGTPKKVS